MKSKIKTLVIGTIAVAAFYLGTGILARGQWPNPTVKTYVCRLDDTVIQKAGLGAPQCPKCGNLMEEYR